MKKLLIVSGDSFSDKNFQTLVHPEMDTSWPKWPELLAKKLDMECINVANSGYGNDYIYESILETIHNTDKDRIGLVIAGWSQAQRKTWQVSKYLRWQNRRYDLDGDIFGWTKRSLRYYLSFQILCERYNLPYFHFQTIPLFSAWLYGLYPEDFKIRKNMLNPDPNFVDRMTYPGDREEDNKELEKMIIDFEKNIDTNKFIGWPAGIGRLGGYCIEHKTTRYDDERGRIKELTISRYDSHPNAKGQEVMAEFIYGRL